MTAQNEVTSILEFLCADQNTVPTAKQVETFSDPLTRVTVGVGNLKRPEASVHKTLFQSSLVQRALFFCSFYCFSMVISRCKSASPALFDHVWFRRSLSS